MLDQLIAVIVNEGAWLPLSMGLALLAAIALFCLRPRSDLPLRRRVLAAMTLFCGVTVGTMALGHGLAVTTKLNLGTLEGSLPVSVLYLIGVALAAPSWSLAYHTRYVLASDGHGPWTLILNTWLAITLGVMGLHNLPLAVSPLLNIAYHLHSNRVLGWMIAGFFVVVQAGLFVASVIFMASGQSFEQFMVPTKLG